MKLKLVDRIQLTNLLPQKGNYEDLIIIKDLIDKIGMKQEEIVKYDIKTEGTSIKWNKEGTEYEGEFEFQKLEIELIKKVFKELVDKKELSMQLLDLYEKFKNL